VRAALDDAAAVHDQDLVGAADGGQAVRDDEGGAALPQPAEAVADERLALAVQARCRLVEDQDARVRDDGAGDGDALPLAAGQLDAALADDGVVAVLEAVDELVRVGDARRACRISSSVASGRAKAMFSRIVPSNRKLSCMTTPSWLR
jgi:hypothetical protein